MKNIMQEITPVNSDDLFIVLHQTRVYFDFPTHYHSDYEINLVKNASGTRIVGDSTFPFAELDLVMLGPRLYHSWQGHTDESSRVVTIQFGNDLFDSGFISKKLFVSVKEMLEKSKRGIEFSDDTKRVMDSRIMRLHKKQGFDSALEFFSILYDLSVSRNQKILSSPSFNDNWNETKSKRIKLVVDYIQKNYQNRITIDEVSGLINMNDTTFCHFFKKRTQRSFVDYLNEIRIGYASRQLIETTDSIAEICYACGFNNISNFNRYFKKKKGMTPSEYRELNQSLITKY
jgi:AraC-like DNA-binding protein